MHNGIDGVMSITTVGTSSFLGLRICMASNQASTADQRTKNLLLRNQGLSRLPFAIHAMGSCGYKRKNHCTRNPVEFIPRHGNDSAYFFESHRIPSSPEKEANAM